MSWTPLIIIFLGACLIWELDERQTMKKYKKKKLTSIKKNKK